MYSYENDVLSSNLPLCINDSVILSVNIDTPADFLPNDKSGKKSSGKQAVTINTIIDSRHWVELDDLLLSSPVLFSLCHYILDKYLLYNH